MRKQKQLTFGSLQLPYKLTDRNRGFIYKITFADGYYYIGKRILDDKGAWMYYQTSSKYVKARLSRIPAKFEILHYHISMHELRKREYQLISKSILDSWNMNYSISGTEKHIPKMRMHKMLGVI